MKTEKELAAALRLVLLFHSASPWDTEKCLAWHNLQIDAGREVTDRDATTKILCDIIREVLGEAP